MTKAVDDLAIANRRLMKKLLVVATIMLGFGFALVPFYERICEVTGIRNVFQPDAIAAQSTQVVYEVKNTLDRPITGQAVPSYSPQQAAPYFRKMECFCFRQQTLAPGEVRGMQVVFVIDPKLPPELNTVTLSYTFFEVNGARGGGG